MEASPQCSMLRSIFYARFHSERGPVVLRQYPRQSIFTSQRNTSRDDNRLVHFNDISSYIIPPYELCNNALSIVHKGYSILGWPVSIEDQKYPRNRFTFNVCFVLDDQLDEDTKRAWSLVVRKTARWLEGIEERDGLLSGMNEDNDLPQLVGQEVESDIVSKVLKQAFQQLTSYGECCVPISEDHVLNLRLDVRAPLKSVPVHAWDVPLLVAELPDQSSTTWDLVLQQTHPHINGINHVQKIAALADVELELVKSTLQPLVAADIVILLDIFHSQAMYAPTADVAWLVRDEQMLRECLEYVTTDQGDQTISTDDLVDLYLSLRPGLTIADIYLSTPKVTSIDLRRTITFGVIKGFLRRVHKYAQLLEPAPTQEEPSRPVTSVRHRQDNPLEDIDQAWKQAAMSSGWATPPTDISSSLKTRARKTEDELRLEQDDMLRRFLDGQHCFDQICVEMGMTEKLVMERLSGDRLGKVSFFTK